RLRSTGLPLYAVVLFFAPMPMNLLFFLALCLLPPRSSEGGLADPILDDSGPTGPAKKPGVLDRTIPQGRTAGAVAAIRLPMPFALAFTALSVAVLRDYGWGVFVGIPFALPMISVIIYGYHSPRRFGECLLLGMLWLLVAYGMLLLLAF